MALTGGDAACVFLGEPLRPDKLRKARRGCFAMCAGWDLTADTQIPKKVGLLPGARASFRAAQQHATRMFSYAQFVTVLAGSLVLSAVRARKCIFQTLTAVLLLAGSRIRAVCCTF